MKDSHNSQGFCCLRLSKIGTLKYIGIKCILLINSTKLKLILLFPKPERSRRDPGPRWSSVPLFVVDGDLT